MDVDIVCVGLACWDLNYYIAEHPGPDDKIHAHKSFGCPGGPALNAAVQIARLGGSVAFLGRLGNDSWGESIADALEHEGVRTGLIHRDHQPTPLATILIKPDGKRSVVSPAPAESLDSTYIQPSDYQPKLFLFDGHQMDVSLALAKSAKEMGIPSLLDAGSNKAGMNELAHLVTHIAASAHYAQSVTDESQSVAAAEKFRAIHDAKQLQCVTHGSEGLYWSQVGQKLKYMKATPVSEVDTNGCGDAFHGALAWAISENYVIAEAIEWAALAGALTATQYGAFPSLPTKTNLTYWRHTYAGPN